MVPVPHPHISAKGEECIPQTWDIFHEKWSIYYPIHSLRWSKHFRWGFMVIFWNFSGVPFVCVHSHSIVPVLNLPQTVLRLLCRLHGFAWPIVIPIHYWWIHLHIYRSMHSLLHVSRLTHLTGLDCHLWFQLGHCHGTEESLQDGDAGHNHIPQDLPPASRLLCQKSYLHSNRTWVHHHLLLSLLHQG